MPVLSTLSPKARLGLAAFTALMSLPGVGHAANVTLTATDTVGQSSFGTGLHWSDLTAPSAGNDYFVPSGLALRTQADGPSAAFAGNSLTIGDNGAAVAVFTLKNAANAVTTVNNLTLNKGSIQNGGTSAGGAPSFTLAGTLVLGAGGGAFDLGSTGRQLIVTSNVSGAGTLGISLPGNAGTSIVNLQGTNTNSGTITANLGITLIANEGVGLSSSAPLVLAGGILGASTDITRGLGTGAGQVSLTGAAGFSATGGNIVVALGGTAAPAPITLNTGGIGTALSLNTGLGTTGTLDFRNSVDLAGNAATVTAGGTTAATVSTISGTITDTAGTGTLTKNGAGTLALTGTNTYAGNTLLTAGTLRANDGVGLSTNSNVTLNGGILETGTNLTRAIGTGAGQLQFGTNTGAISAFGADITVAFGGTASPTPLVFDTTPGFITGAGFLTLGSGNQTNTLTFANSLDLATPLATTVRNIAVQGGTSVINGVISNTGAAQGTLAIDGNGVAVGGTLVLAGANTYGGTTLIDSGGAGSATVRATNSQAFGTSLIQFTTVGNATLARLELANNVSIANQISLSARANTSVAIQNISGNNTLSGTIGLIAGGSNYIIQSDSGLLTLSGTTGATAGVALQSNAGSRVPTLQGAGNGVVSGVIANGTGTIGIIKAGTGTWTLTGVNTYTGVTTVTAGTLQLGDGTSGRDGTIAATSGISVASGATLAYNRFGTATSDRVITGAGGVAKLGAGTQILTGANTYTGTTTVSGGTLQATSPAYTNLLANAGGVDLGNTGGKLVLDYTGGSSPVGTVKTLLTTAYASNFATGQIKSTTLAAGRTIGYGDNGAGLVTARVTLAGDADLDGDVDFNDFLVLQTNFGAANTRFDQGNFNYDAATDFNDFLVLQTNFGQSVGFGPVAVTSEQVAAMTAFANANAVPEPAALALLGIGGMMLGRRRTRSARVCDKM